MMPKKVPEARGWGKVSRTAACRYQGHCHSGKAVGGLTSWRRAAGSPGLGPTRQSLAAAQHQLDRLSPVRLA